MRTYGNCGPVVVATTGIELPDPDASRIDFAAIRVRVAEQTRARREVLAVVAAGPVICDVCGVVVAAEYVARTGQRRHGPCQDRTTPARTVPAQFGGRRAKAGRARVRAVA